MPLHPEQRERLTGQVAQYKAMLALQEIAWQKQHDASEEFEAACGASKKMRELLGDFVSKAEPRVLVTLADGCKAIVRDGEGYKEARVEFYTASGQAVP